MCQLQHRFEHILTLQLASLHRLIGLQVIFLDSDNVALTDPEMLFGSAGYKQTGAVLWPDYWLSSAAPDLQLILDVPSMADNTFESGQMVFDKKRFDPIMGVASIGL